MCVLEIASKSRMQAISSSLLASIMVGLAAHSPSVLAAPTRSTNIAITADQTKLLNLNHDTGSVTVFQVNPTAAGQQALERLTETAVGKEPGCIAIHPDGSRAYITTADGFVSVLSLQGAARYTVTDQIRVQTEPRGCALTPSGAILYVANHTAGSVSIIDTSNNTIIKNTGDVFGNPYAIAISDANNDGRDAGEVVFVTDFYAEAKRTGAHQGGPFDDGSRGVVRAFQVGAFNFPRKIPLSGLADSGFTADRTLFCPPTPGLHSEVYCPTSNITADPQGAYPNQLHAAVIRKNRMFLPNIGAAPEPPFKFNVNVQALVNVVNTAALAEVTRFNLNLQIKGEPIPADPTASLGHLFGNDIVAIDANTNGTEFVLVSRGGNYVLRAKQGPGNVLDIGAPNNVVRLQTGHIPTGIVMSRNGQRAYTNNEVGRSVSVLNLVDDTVVARDIPSTDLPLLGSLDHNVLMGKLVFFTALGVPDNDLAGRNIRSINPLKFRGKQSDNGWSTCGSCHPAGLADGVTWIFPDGPVQSIPLDATESKRNPGHDARILNWHAVRGSNTDFNQNSRAVQGGCGFASDDFDPGQCLIKTNTTPANPHIYNHGITQGASEALDDETAWIQTVRPFAQPQPKKLADLTPGGKVFEDNCASCHGSDKWTKSVILYRDNPAFNANPAVGGVPLDPGVGFLTPGGRIQSFNPAGKPLTLTYLEDVGTFDVNNPVEIKQNGTTAFGAEGFNVPSLLDVRYHAPYFHDGSATTLPLVFAKHALNGGTITTKLSKAKREDLLKFLNALDGSTDIFRSQADEVRDQF